MTKVINNQHVPTDEELAAQEAELDEENPNDTPPDDETPPKDTQNDTDEDDDDDDTPPSDDESDDDSDEEDDENSDPDDSDDEDDDSQDDDSDEEDKNKPPKKKEPVTDTNRNMKKRLADASREAMVQNFRNKKIAEKAEEANNLPDPTEDELKTASKAKGMDWDTMTQNEKALFKTSLISDRRFAHIHSAIEESKEVEQWAGSVDEFLEDDKVINKYPKLKGLEDEFKKFCMKPTRRGLDLEDLVAAFLYNPVINKSKHKGSLLLTAKGGHKPTPKAGLTADDAATIRKGSVTDYMRRVKAGKVNIDV